MNSPNPTPRRRLEVIPAPAELLQRLHRRVHQLIATNDPRYVETDQEDRNKKFLRIVLQHVIVFLSVTESNNVRVFQQNYALREMREWQINEGGNVVGGSQGVREEVVDEPPIFPDFVAKHIISHFNHPGCPREIEVEPTAKTPPEIVGWGRRVLSQILGLLPGGRG